MSSKRTSYKLAILEIRSRLRSVNAFIHLNETGKPEIVLDEDSIKIVIGEEVAKISCKDIKILPHSLSSVQIADNYLTFRFGTDNNPFENAGGFETELLQNTVSSMESLSNKPLLSKGIKYVISCINCGRSLTEPLQFDRILPLPSDGTDPSEWFCHNHGGKNEFNLDPKLTDIFYTHCLVHINASNIKNVNSTDKVLVCKFCLNWLGIKHNKNTVRFWHNTVKFTNNDTAISTFSLPDVFQSIKSSLNHTLHNSIKLIITCQSTSNTLDIILLWILEKNLRILFDDSSSAKISEVAKVLFKFVEDTDKMFLQWHNDTLVDTISISKPMMTELLRHLYKYNKILPKEFSKSNEFFVSYLFLYDTFEE